MATAAASCRNHPEREAIGICVECRARICSECVTKVDGINYCVSCLAALADRGEVRRAEERRPTPAWLSALAAMGLWGLVTLMTWGLLEVAFPGGG
ncbi:MAG: B-box zinc finger protein [Sandaracinaceae bacterium]|nr:B-box zinc finger protein [Sandaracinaceae bacterium]